VTVGDGRVVIAPVNDVELTLEQRLAQFAPARHGGEAIASAPLGTERR
jgi:antitoxin MazE